MESQTKLHEQIGNYIRSPYGQALQPANYQIESFNFVGCSNFKREPAVLADKYQKTI